MSEAALSVETQLAIAECVRSVEELEILMVLARNRERYWSPDTVAVETGLPAQLATVALEALGSRNLLDVRIGAAVLYRLDPASSECGVMVDRTLEAARNQRSQVLRAILQGRSAARDFADAFKVTRKRRSDG
jgi:hypothetical protein